MHELEVLALRVVDQRHGGRRDAREVGDLARVVHAELDRAAAMLRAQAQQSERQADVVVEVAERREHRLVACVPPQDRSEHLLYGGLAVGAHDRDERRCKALPPVARKVAESQPRVLDHERRQRLLAGVAPVDHRRCGAARGSLREELVPVEALAAQRHEELPRAQLAAVRRYALERRVAARGARAEQRRCFPQRHHAPPLFASAARATAMSENGTRRPAIS